MSVSSKLARPLAPGFASYRAPDMSLTLGKDL